MAETADQRRQRILGLRQSLETFDNTSGQNDMLNKAMIIALQKSGDVPVMPEPQFRQEDFQRLQQLRNPQQGNVTTQAEIDEEKNLINLLNTSQPPVSDATGWYNRLSSTNPQLNYSTVSQITDPTLRNQQMSMLPEYGLSDEELRSQYDLSPSNLAVNIARQAAANQSLSRNAVDEQQMTGYRAGTPFMYPTDPNAKSTGYGYNSENTDDSDQFKPVAASNYSPVNIQNAKTQALQVLNSPRQALASTTTPTAKQDIWANRNNVPTPPTRPTSGPAAASQPGFFSRLFSGDNYQSNNQLVAPKGSKDPTEINWGNSDSNADFFRASQALQKMDPNYVANNADDTFDNGHKRGGAVKEKKHDPLHHALSLISHILGHKHQ
jgi:hypothetical protein